jgi:hypothetical protein
MLDPNHDDAQDRGCDGAVSNPAGTARSVDILLRVSPKLALQIGAVLATIFGLALALLPAQMLAGFGLATPSDALVVPRDLGVTLLGLAVITGSRATRRARPSAPSSPARA